MFNQQSSTCVHQNQSSIEVPTNKQTNNSMANMFSSWKQDNARGTSKLQQGFTIVAGDSGAHSKQNNNSTS